MVYKLLEEYKALFDFNKNFYKYFNKKKSAFVIIVTCMILISSILLSIYYNNPVFYIGDTIPLYLFFALHKKEIDRILKDIYEFSSKREYYKHRKEEFFNIVKLNKINFRNKEQMDMLFNLLENELNELRPKQLINDGITVGLFAPVWIGFITYIFEKEVMTLTGAFTYLILISICIILILCI